MTDNTQPEALRLAGLLELAPEDGVEPQTTEDAATELRRLHAEHTTLQAGYAAARMEIESLQARIKTMAEEHAEELMVAHMDGIMRAALAAAPPTQPAPQHEAQEPATIDQKTMELAESVGLIGPASRVGELHAAIQRFHDLICVNATIKAAVMAADVIRGVATPARDYPPLPMQFACSGVFPVYSADQMRAYVDADRAARAPADSVLEDAARYRYLRDGDWREHEKLESIIRLQLNALWDETIDAARKQGANHD